MEKRVEEARFASTFETFGFSRSVESFFSAKLLSSVYPLPPWQVLNFQPSRKAGPGGGVPGDDAPASGSPADRVLGPGTSADSDAGAGIPAPAPTAAEPPAAHAIHPGARGACGRLPGSRHVGAYEAGCSARGPLQPGHHLVRPPPRPRPLAPPGSLPPPQTTL